MRLKEAQDAKRLTTWSPELVTLLKINEFSGAETRSVTVLPGQTVLSYVRDLTPDLTEDERRELRVTLHDGPEVRLLDQVAWRLVKLKPGAFIAIRPPAPKSGNVFRQVLQVVVAVAAMAIATAIGGPLGMLAAAAFMFGANYLINALVPLKDGSKDKKVSPTYSLQGFRNPLNPDGVVPLVVGGRHRFAPPYIVPPVPRIVDGKMFVSCAFICGFAPMGRWKERIGDRLLERFRKITIEYRGFVDGEGATDTSPFTIVRETVIPQDLDIEIRNFEDGAEEGDEEFRAEPTSVFTAADTQRWKAIFQFPEGLFRSRKKNGKATKESVTLCIRERPVTPDNDGEWTVLEEEWTVEKKKTRPFYVEYERKADLPARGAYEIEFDRVNKDDDSDREHSVIKLISFQSWLPEYPVSQPEDHPFAMIAVDCQATNQLQGTLDDFNLEAAQLIEAWNSTAGAYEAGKETANPADWYRHILTMPIRAEPLPLSALNGPEIVDWHAHNASNGLNFRRVYDYEVDLEDVLDEVCQVGRAVKRISDGRWGVSIDRRKDTLKAEPITPHNTWSFELSRSYRKLPDAWRIKFKDELNDFRDAERIVPLPHYAGDDPQVLEELEPPGITHPTQIYVFGTMRGLELVHRPDMFSTSQDWEAMALEHGDLTLATHPMLERRTGSGRVAAVIGSAILLDEPVEMEEGGAYAIYFRRHVEVDGKAYPQVLIRSVWTDPGETDTVRLVGEGDLPDVGAVFGFGPASAMVEECLVQAVENDDRGDARLSLINYAPEIFDALDALVVPPYSSRVGDILAPDLRAPGQPIIFSIASSDEVYGDDETMSDSPRRVVVTVQPSDDLPAAAKIVLRHRAGTESVWRTPVLEQDAASATFTLSTGYAKGQTIVVQATPVSRNDVEGPASPTRSHFVGSDDVIGPDVLSFTAEAGVDGLDRYAWTTADATARAQIRIGPDTATTWDELTPIHGGYLTSSPLLIDNPTGPGAYTVGIRLTSEAGDVGPETLISYTVT